MVDERARFQTTGPTWAERAPLGGLRAVVSTSGGRSTDFLHGIHSYAAALALGYFPASGYIIDFGCGNGRFSHHFSAGRRRVIGTEITWEMALEAKRNSAPPDRCNFIMTDGISIPVADRAASGVWTCGVLRYSLLVDDPCYREIAAEMFRVLEPGGHVVTCEFYVDVPADRFTAPFESVGFATQRVSVLNRYGFLERCLRNRFLPRSWMTLSGTLCGALRHRFDSPARSRPGLRDYLFVWRKPEASAPGG
jgi:SAM-dependent methyltransferase